MDDDFDVEAMLEAPFQKSDESFKKKIETRNGESKSKHRSSTSRSRSRERKRSKSKDRKRSRSRSRDKKRSSRERKGKDRKRSRSKERRRSKDRKRSRSKDRKRSRSRERKRSRSHERKRRSRSRDHKRSRSRESRRRERRRSKSRSPFFGGRDFHRRPRGRSRSPIKRPPAEEMTPEERDARTVFCMQLSARVRARDIEEFFSSVGKVTDVRLITDNKTRRSKGICYVEFKEVSSVPLAMGLTGQKLLSVPIIVQPSQAEKNRAAATASNMQKGNTGPMRLYVGSLHFNITEEMLKGIFEPFGKIDSIQLMMDPETGRSKGYGFISFHNSEDAKKALEQLNGFELAGRPMKVNHVTERTDMVPGPSFLDSEELDKSGIDLGATGRLHLMAKLAEGTGMELPPAAQNALNLNSTSTPTTTVQTSAVTTTAAVAAPPIATQSFMLSNMFDLAGDLSASWDQEIRDDVLEECRKHGGVVHVYVDKASPQGNVYVKCPTINAAAASVNSLHGRFFAGKVITAAYVPLINYHNLFPDALNSHTLL